MAKAPKTCGGCGLPLEGRSMEGLCAVCLLESTLDPEQELVVDDSTADVAWLTREGILPPAAGVVEGRRFGEYALEREVARGGMGIIYRAHDLRR